MGFSAGGELAWLVSSRNDNGLADASDAVDKSGSRPAFQALIYPGRAPDIQPTKDAPPVFLRAGHGDRKDISEGPAKVNLRFERAGVPAGLHLYAGTRDGSGLRTTNKSRAGAWPTRFEEWLADRKLLVGNPWAICGANFPGRLEFNS